MVLGWPCDPDGPDQACTTGNRMERLRVAGRRSIHVSCIDQIAEAWPQTLVQDLNLRWEDELKQYAAIAGWSSWQDMAEIRTVEGKRQSGLLNALDSF